jgi:hypothetical protein|tara:strand:- start:1364 stop:1639 length:276 start_codon:yes stop_codon:yes gene_type:complete
MVTRSDATPLSIQDRYYLVESAVNMVEEGIDLLYEEAVEDGVDPDDFNFIDSLESLRSVSYADILQRMISNNEDAKALITLMKQNTLLTDE